VTGGVREFTGEQEYRNNSQALHDAFSRAETPEVLHLLDRNFDQNIYSLKSLFRDDQRKILDIILSATLAQAEHALRQQYAEHAPLMRFLADLRVDQPTLFHTLAQFAINSELREALQKDDNATDRVRSLVQEAASMHVDIDAQNLEFIVRKQTEQRAYAFWRNPTELPQLERLESAVHRARTMPFKVNLWKVQNLAAQRLDGTLSSMREQASQGDENAKAWVNHMDSLADTLGLRVS
jgi:hypothetical protein